MEVEPEDMIKGQRYTVSHADGEVSARFGGVDGDIAVFGLGGGAFVARRRADGHWYASGSRLRFYA